MNILRRRVMEAEVDDSGYVDLGLSVKWAVGNIVVSGNGYAIGNETDFGAYTSWANIVPHFATNTSAFDDGYNWGSSNTGIYASTPGASLTTDITPASGYDIARELLGGKWRLPTKAEVEELKNNCNKQWSTKNGIRGALLTSKINGNQIFFPAQGRGKNAKVENRGSNCQYWTATIGESSGTAFSYQMDSSSYVVDYINRYIGFGVRAVK